MGFTQCEALLDLRSHALAESGDRVRASYSWLNDLDFAALCSNVLESCLSCALRLHTMSAHVHLWRSKPVVRPFCLCVIFSVHWGDGKTLICLVLFHLFICGAETHTCGGQKTTSGVLFLHHMNHGDWKCGGKHFYPHLFGFEWKGEPRFFLPLLNLTSAAFVRLAGAEGICVPQPWHHQPSVREGVSPEHFFCIPLSLLHPATHSHSVDPLTYGQYTVALMQTLLAQTQI